MTDESVILGAMPTRLPVGLVAASAGCYEAARAAALSGVPRSTVHHWARTGVVVPSISPEREKLWSFADLMALRIVVRLRKPKKEGDQVWLPASPMGKVREALGQLAARNIHLWSEDAPARASLVVDQKGDIFLRMPDGFTDLRGNAALPHGESFGLLDPFEFEGHHGPDLVRPRPHLRIVPERVAGEPHAEGTRITTQTLAGLAARGFSVERMAKMYRVPEEAVREAVELEHALSAA